MGKQVKTTVGPRWAKFCGWALKKMGWTSVGGPMPEAKAIVLGVPHTTVRDFVVSYLFYTQFGKVAHIMIKKEFFFWPLGPILRACGAVPVERKSAATLVKSLITLMEEAPEFWPLRRKVPAKPPPTGRAVTTLSPAKPAPPCTWGTTTGAASASAWANPSN